MENDHFDSALHCRECGRDIHKLGPGEKIVLKCNRELKSHAQCHAAREAMRDFLCHDHIMFALETWWNSPHKEDRQVVESIIDEFPNVKERLLAGSSAGCIFS